MSFTSLQWVSAWMLKTDHITLSTVPSKTEHRILYAIVDWLGIPKSFFSFLLLDFEKTIIKKIYGYAKLVGVFLCCKFFLPPSVSYY